MKLAVAILDHSTGQPIQATLFDEVTVEHFLEAQTEWRPLVLLAARRLALAGGRTDDIPLHWHWDWSRKEPELSLLAITFYGVECRGRLQGLMKVDTVSQCCRLREQQGQPLVYIDYLEVAPWNIRKLTAALDRQPEFGAVGTRLVEAAVRQSMAEGFEGRVGLHSLPTSERFYLDGCGMLPGDLDTGKQELLWCEFTPERAERFLKGRRP